jgi:hypothetical protein
MLARSGLSPRRDSGAIPALASKAVESEDIGTHLRGWRRISMRLLYLALVVVLLAGCTTPQLPTTSFAKPAVLQRTMKRYYEAHASEDRGQCLNPYIDGLTQVSVVEKQPERLVVDVRYLYRDWQKDNSGPNSMGGVCTGYAGRRFTFGKDPKGGVEVLDMTGPRRN